MAHVLHLLAGRFVEINIPFNSLGHRWLPWSIQFTARMYSYKKEKEEEKDETKTIFSYLVSNARHGTLNIKFEIYGSYWE